MRILLATLALCLMHCSAEPPAPIPASCDKQSDCGEPGMTCDTDAGVCRACRLSDAGYCL
jgi:hypothetical protein